MFEMSERSVCGIEWSTPVVSVAPIYVPNMVMMMFLWVGFFSFRFTISQLCIFMHLEYTWSSSFFWWHFFFWQKRQTTAQVLLPRWKKMQRKTKV